MDPPPSEGHHTPSLSLQRRVLNVEEEGQEEVVEVVEVEEEEEE